MQSSQWDKGKGCDTFGPVGPWLVTCDEIPDPRILKLWLDVNGERRQNGHTGSMIFSVAEIVSCISQYMTLNPGDVICTGTPPGVGRGRERSWSATYCAAEIAARRVMTCGQKKARC
nr:fumarylacetoacetate hydrolase family protein [Pseudomonas sp. NBRC 111134]